MMVHHDSNDGDSDDGDMMVSLSMGTFDSTQQASIHQLKLDNKHDTLTPLIASSEHTRSSVSGLEEVDALVVHEEVVDTT